MIFEGATNYGPGKREVGGGGGRKLEDKTQAPE